MRAIWLLVVSVMLVLHDSAPGQCSGAEANLSAVWRALDREDTAEAQRILNFLRQSYSDCSATVLDDARLSYLLGEKHSAEGEFNRYIHLEPEDAKGYAYLARLYSDEERYTAAQAALQQAVQADPAEPAALALEGQLLGTTGQLDHGISLLEQACLRDPVDAEAHYQLGVLYAGVKRRAEAAAQFQKSLSIVPNNAQAWDYLALDLELLGEPEGAEEAYRKGEAVNHDGRHFDGFLDYNYGRFLIKRNKLKEAKEHLDRAVELAPSFRAVWYERARANLALKDFSAAQADAEKAASVADTDGVILDIQTYALLEEIYQRVGAKDLAEKYADLSRRMPKTPGQTRQ